ncbi:unnamed protein product [Closterium sp. Naga37s-1]|nr:unnamed protein product [Closterium sp. Naga37s-1]
MARFPGRIAQERRERESTVEAGVQASTGDSLPLTFAGAARAGVDDGSGSSSYHGGLPLTFAGAARAGVDDGSGSSSYHGGLPLTFAGAARAGVDDGSGSSSYHGRLPPSHLKAFLPPLSVVPSSLPCADPFFPPALTPHPPCTDPFSSLRSPLVPPALIPLPPCSNTFSALAPPCRSSPLHLSRIPHAPINPPSLCSLLLPLRSSAIPLVFIPHSLCTPSFTCTQPFPLLIPPPSPHPSPMPSSLPYSLFLIRSVFIPPSLCAQLTPSPCARPSFPLCSFHPPAPMPPLPCAISSFSLCSPSFSLHSFHPMLLHSSPSH